MNRRTYNPAHPLPLQGPNTPLHIVGYDPRDVLVGAAVCVFDLVITRNNVLLPLRLEEDMLDGSACPEPVLVEVGLLALWIDH